MFNYVMILAAGRGTRLKEYTSTIPKALVDVNNRPVIEYSIDQLREKCNAEVCLTVNRIHSDHLFYYARGKSIETIIDVGDKENAWWLFNSFFQEVNEPVLVLACDNLTSIDIDFVVNSYLSLDSPPCMLIPVKALPEIEGDFIEVVDQKVRRIGRDLDTNIYCSGMQVINPFLIAQVCETTGRDFFSIWNELCCKELLFSSAIYPYPWYSINTPMQLSNASIFLNKNSIL